MNHSRELQLTVKGGEEELRDVLEKVTGVSTVEHAEAEEGFASVKVGSEENKDIREAVFYALAEAGLPIMEMTAREESLEDIFLELTSGGQPAEKEQRKIFGGKRKKREEK